MSSSAGTEKFNVVILYEQRAFVGRAMSTYFHLKRELGNELETDLHLWRIDVATTAEYAAQADHDIAEADVIILAVRGGRQPCPPTFLRWITGMGSSLGVPRRAVITITEAIAEPTPEPTPATETWSSVLHSFTTQIHPEIYVWDPPEVLGEAAPEPLADELVPALAGVGTAD
jgi:hypothetical protein